MKRDDERERGAELDRRDALKRLAVAAAGGVAAGAVASACGRDPESAPEPETSSKAAPTSTSTQEETMAGTPTRNPILATHPLGFPWKTLDPFLFCVHHDDRYPRGDERLGPVASLAGRELGMDFAGKDGWRMYHGRVVPGFPQHPHRGFETVTVVRSGRVDHSDSMGAAARYGGGDVQWLTAGKGILHAEMFPLLHRDRDNPLELFQIWLNLPARDKFAEPHFTMFWDEQIPRVEASDEAGKKTVVTMTAGTIGDRKALAPPPASWASRPESDLAIWQIAMQADARWTLPSAKAGTNRMLYVFKGAITVGGVTVQAGTAAQLVPDLEVGLAAVGEAEALVLQGRPIGEPVVQYGPFVMNSEAEIRQAYADFRRTQFGGWPWDRDDPVHPISEDRFARHADGKVDKPT
jgi:hypothetical protein